jgi:hypothetical protein
MEDKNIKKMQVKKDSELKEWLIDYVGNKENPKDEGVTVEMIINIMADEFPEFLFVVAQENFLRGYEQALDDVKMLNEENDQNTQIYQKNSHSNN